MALANWRDTEVLDAVLAAVADPLIVVDAASVILRVNDAAQQAWPNLRVGSPLSFTLREPDLVDAVSEVLAGTPLVEGTLLERVPVIRSFGFRATASVSPGRARAAVLAFRDLTEARRLESMRTDFVANASHELRTPLASVLGFIETLEGPARHDPAARERFLSIMRAQAQRMARLIDDLLSLSRVEMSEHRRPEDSVDLVAVASQAVDTLKPIADERGVTVEVIVPDEPLFVLGDRDELLRVADNLIENALKYGGSGGRVAVQVEAVDETGHAPAARLSVRDWGPGIALQHLPRLTERFYRVDVVDSRSQGGTGLGLALVKHIVNRHRGRLTVESRPGEGAVFRVSLPRTPEAGQQQRSSR